MMKEKSLTLFLVMGLTLVGCGKKESSGGYYSDDGPPSDNAVATAVEPTPVAQLPLSKTGNDPYDVYGKNYYPRREIEVGYTETGMASWYGTKFHGKRTSSGETYDMMAFTAAHKTLPLPTYVRVTSLDNDRSVIVKVNDRGPFLRGRIIDLSFVAAKRLGIADKGTGMVRIEVVDGTNREQPQRGQSIELAQPLEIKSEPLNPEPLGSSAAMANGSLDAGTMPNSAGLDASDEINEVPAAGMGSAQILERKSAQIGQGNSQTNASTTMTDHEDIILPSVPGTPTATTLPIQSGPVVDINSIVRSSDHFIQAGAFSSRDNAYKVLNKYVSKGYTCRVLTGADGIYRVQIGPYASEGDASATMGLLRAAGDGDLKLIKPQ